MWSAGSISGICLLIQLLSGIFLAMYYVPHIDYAFMSVEHIMRDVEYGWFFRYCHSNGASFFFIFVYIHILRNLYFGSYLKNRKSLWFSGILIFLAMMATAFLGYVLPWGQMSFWGATVITNLFSVLPFFGEDLVQWLWGGYSVSNSTLNKFYSFHFILPFIIVFLVFIHLLLLHKVGSSNPLGLGFFLKYLNFYPYFLIKDIHSLSIFFFIFFYVVCFHPNMFGHPDNYIEANPLVTPAHIVPEWYFLPFYAILRSIPSKSGGVFLMFFSIFCLFILPFVDISRIRSSKFKILYLNFIFWLFIVDCILLGWLGQKPVEDPFIILSQLITFFYFIYFITVFFFSNKESFK